MKEILKDYDVKMQKTVDVVVSDFASVRAGRANAAVLDKIAVDYYGSATPINQVAAISSPDRAPAHQTLGRLTAQSLKRLPDLRSGD